MIPKLYDELAEWWPLMCDPQSYRRAARTYSELIREAGPVRSVLELGSGGGSAACFLKEDFELTLVDSAPRMLEVSAKANPECRHVCADMRNVRLDASFDAVLIEDAIGYMTTRGDLLEAIRTASAHCVRGGVCLFLPDSFRETYAPGAICGGRDDGQRGLRYLEWRHESSPSGTTCETDFALLLRHETGVVEAVYDRHTCGLFRRNDWAELCRAAGLSPCFRELSGDDTPSEAIVCKKP